MSVWTLEKDCLLRQYYVSEGPKPIMEACPELSLKAIYARANKLRLIRKENVPEKLTSEQIEVITGNLLGDGSISWKPKKTYNNFFSIRQCSAHAEYLEWLADIFKPYTSQVCEIKSRKPKSINGKINHEIENWNGEFCYSKQFYTCAHSIFSSLRLKWYKSPHEKKSPKNIPRDIKLTWRIAAIWHMDDGSIGQKHSRKIIIATNSFSEDDVNFLLYRLKQDLGVLGKISFDRKKQPVIGIYGDSVVSFVEGIHSGLLPSQSWLQKNNHGYVSQLINKYPDLFCHIKQHKRLKSPDEWVSFAEKLLLCYGGILPGPYKLKKDGYSGLENAMYKYPEKFIHIKQDKKLRK
jgi:hypothetical protein